MDPAGRGGGSRARPAPAPPRTASAALLPRRIRLDLAYDGSDFAGWQLQPGRDTIQGRVEAALSRLFGRSARRRRRPSRTGSPRAAGPTPDQPTPTPRIVVIAAGRTDAGVHAERQVAHFDAPNPGVPPAGIRDAVNHLLPRAIRVLAAAEAPPGFHAQYDAVNKTYRYHLLPVASPSPLRTRFAWATGPGLDREAMAEAASSFLGAHDFRAFFRASAERPRRPTRKVIESRLFAAGDELVFEVTANGFERYMVRRMAGALVAAGRGQLAAAAVAAMLAAPETPACGLGPPRSDCGSTGWNTGPRGEPEIRQKRYSEKSAHARLAAARASATSRGSLGWALQTPGALESSLPEAASA